MRTYYIIDIFVDDKLFDSYEEWETESSVRQAMETYKSESPDWDFRIRKVTEEYICAVKAHIQAAMRSAAQRQWVGLTDEEIDKTHETQVWDARRSYARAIEAKLKEKNSD